MNCDICLLNDPREVAREAIGQCEGCARPICRQHTETCCDSLMCEFCHESHLHTILPPESEIVVDLIKTWLLPTARKGARKAGGKNESNTHLRG